MIDLRAERERQGLSLDEVSSQAQIPLRYLEALESGDAAFRRSVLPSGPFLRSYQRQYLEFLGLDPEVMDEAGYSDDYDDDYDSDEDGDGDESDETGVLPPAGAEPTLTSPADSGEIPLMRLVVAGFMLTLAMVLALRVVSLLVDSGGGRARDVEPAPAAPPVAAVSAAEPTEAPEIPEEIAAEAAEDVTEDGPPTPAQLAALPTARLRIRAVEPTRITARVDEQDAYQGTLPAGDVIDLEAKDEIEVWAADLTTILITYNGERIEPLGNLSQGRKLVFIHDGGK